MHSLKHANARKHCMETSGFLEIFSVTNTLASFPNSYTNVQINTWINKSAKTPIHNNNILCTLFYTRLDNVCWGLFPSSNMGCSIVITNFGCWIYLCGATCHPMRSGLMWWIETTTWLLFLDSEQISGYIALWPHHGKLFVSTLCNSGSSLLFCSSGENVCIYKKCDVGTLGTHH